MTWLPIKLGDLLSLEYGRALRKDMRDGAGSIPVAGSNGVDGYHTHLLVNGPGIVVGRKGSAGKVTWFDTDFWPIDTAYFVQPRVDCCMRWLYYLLNHLRLDRLAITTGVPGLNRDDAYRSRLRLPTPSEQRRIVEILDQADALRQQRRTTDEKAQHILPALFHRMFGDPATWHADGSTEPLGKLVQPQGGGTPSKKNPDYWDGDVPWVSPKDMKRDFIVDSEDHITKQALEETNSRLVPVNSILTVVRGMILARHVPLAINVVPVTINQDMKALTVTDGRVSPLYLFAAMKVLGTRLHAHVGTAGHGTRKLDTDRLLSLPIHIPDKTRHDDFVRWFESVRVNGGPKVQRVSRG